MSTAEIANRLVELCRKGQNALAQVELYDDNIESIESQKLKSRKVKGIKKVQRKTAMFFEMVQKIHNYEYTDPLIIEDHFCFKLTVDVTLRGIGRITLNEICMYHVKNEKIIKEEIYYAQNIKE